MRFSFNLPGRVTKIKIVLTEENEGQVVQEKEYTIKREQLDIFDNEYKRAAYINSLIGYDWRNPVSKRGKVEKRKEESEEQAKFAAEEGGNVE